MESTTKKVTGMITVDCRRDESWLVRVLEALQHAGVAIVTGVLDDDLLVETREHLYNAQSRIRADVGEERLTRAGELGVLRLLLGYDPFFFRFLALPEVLAVVDAAISDTAILHVQNGLVLPPATEAERTIFQRRFHRDFPRILNGYPMSVNTFFAIDEFNPDTGSTQLVPGTHQREGMPPEWYLEEAAVSSECPAGSMIVFDSTLWHAAGVNSSGRDRMALNQQFTRSWVKQQVDYVRALGDEAVLAQPPRTQQLLGWYTRVVTSLDEYYRPAEDRLYRGGQG
jgi:ectoine hydroxylase-related dioxygenase (phytanoyl-CoA dioxygenase family)